MSRMQTLLIALALASTGAVPAVAGMNSVDWLARQHIQAAQARTTTAVAPRATSDPVSSFAFTNPARVPVLNGSQPGPTRSIRRGGRP
jgi:hypothetical protein